MRVLTLAVLLAAATGQGFIEWRVGSVFEHLLAALGVNLQPSAFSAAFDADRCSLSHESVFKHLQLGFDAVLLDDDAAAVRKGVRTIAKALRAFGKSCQRCDLTRVSAKLLLTADEAGTLAAHDVRWGAAIVGKPLTILVNEANVSGPLRLAANAWFREKYEGTGTALGQVVREVAGADAPSDSPADFDTWQGVTPEGRVKTQGEYIEHMRSEYERARALQREAEETRPWQGPRFEPPFQGAMDYFRDL